MLETLFYLIAILVGIYILGYGISDVLLPTKLRPYFFWLTPWICILFVIIMSVQMSLLGISASISAPAIAISLLALSLYRYLNSGPKLQLTKTGIIIVGIVFMDIIFNIIPILRREGVLTTISMGNNDIIAYVTSADYLVNHTLQESLHNNILLTISNLLLDGYRWGPSMITAFFLSLYSMSGYQIGYLMQAILFGLTLPLLYVLLRILYKPNFWGMLISIIMTAFNANLIYMLYHNFFGMVLFWGIEMMLLILFFAYYGTDEEKVKHITRFDLLIALSISTLYFSYHETAIFLFAPLVLYFFGRLIFRTQPIYYLKKIFTSIAIALSIASMSVYNAIIIDFGQAFTSNKNQPIGWELFRQENPFANPFEALGLYSIHSFPSLPNIISYPLSLLTIAVIIWGIFKARQRLLAICYVLIFVLFYYWSGVVNHHFFDYNRTITYTLPLIIVLFTIGFLELVKNKYLKTGIALMMIVLVMFSALKLNKKFRQIYVAVDTSIISLSAAPIQNISEQIYTEGFVDAKTAYWIQNWTSYFIYKGDVAKLPSMLDPVSNLNRIPENSLVLVGKYTRWYHPPKQLVSEIIWENEYYKIGTLCKKDECIKKIEDDISSLTIGSNDWENVLLKSGWAENEGDVRWMNAPTAKLRLLNNNPATHIVIEAKSLKEPQIMSMVINDVITAEMLLSTDWEIYSYPIVNSQDGIYSIQFQIQMQDNLVERYTDENGLERYAGFKRFAIE